MYLPYFSQVGWAPPTFAHRYWVTEPHFDSPTALRHLNLLSRLFVSRPTLRGSFAGEPWWAVPTLRFGGWAGSGGEGRLFHMRDQVGHDRVRRDAVGLSFKVENHAVPEHAGRGGAEILASDAFQKATPYNAPFAASVDTMRDFWNVPCFNELLAVTQRYVGMAVDGEMDTKEALKKLAEEKERILKENGLL